MAGSSCTVTQSVKKHGGVIVERLVTLAFVSDDADGTVPDQELTDLDNYLLDEIITTPGAGALAPTAVYRVAVQDDDSANIFLGTSRSLSEKERQGGYEYTGKTPAIDSTITVVLKAADGTTAASIGNSNAIEVVLRLGRK